MVELSALSQVEILEGLSTAQLKRLAADLSSRIRTTDFMLRGRLLLASRQ